MRNAMDNFRTNLWKPNWMFQQLVKVDRIHPPLHNNRKQKQRKFLDCPPRSRLLLVLLGEQLQEWCDEEEDGYLTHHLQQKWKTSSLSLRKGSAKGSLIGELI
jgi:hypothetical protein